MIKAGQTWRNGYNQLVTVFASALGHGQFTMRRAHTLDNGYRVGSDGIAYLSNDRKKDLLEQVARVYIGGPMTGLPESNYPAFHAAAKDYRGRGNFVVNPAELHPKGPLDIQKEWVEYMRVDIAALMTCEILVLLPGWLASKGARLEHHNARELGFGIVYPTNERI